MSDDQQWFLYTEDGQQGPYPAEILQGFLTNGQITGEWLVWREGMETWQPLNLIPELIPPQPSANGKIWFIYSDGAKQGPYSAEDINTLLVGGQIRKEVMGWREGFPDWKAISSIPEFAGSKTTQVELQPLYESPIAAAVAPSAKLEVKVPTKKCPACRAENTTVDLCCVSCGVNFREWDNDQRKKNVSEARKHSQAMKASSESSSVSSADDNIGCLMGGVCFLFPIVGIIMYFVWRKSYPNKAKMASYIAGFSMFLGAMARHCAT